MAALPSSGLSVARKEALLPSFEGLRHSPSAFQASPRVRTCDIGLTQRCFRGLIVKAATIVAPKHTAIKPLADRVLVKIKSFEEKTSGGILLPTTAQAKPQGGEVVAVGEGRTIGKTKVGISVQAGALVMYSKYAGTELELDGSSHILLEEDDIVGVLDSNDVKELQPLGDRVLIKIAQAEERTTGGLILTEASKEKPSIGMVIAVGPGSLDEEGTRKPLSITPGETVLYSKYSGSEFNGADGSDYIALRASDVMAVLSTQ